MVTALLDGTIQLRHGGITAFRNGLRRHRDPVDGS